MPDKIEFVQIEAGEDATSVRDRLSFLRGQRVLLIWPEEGTALTRKLDLVLIQREAMRRAIRLALVTHDPLVMQHARELNISTFETIGASERGRWKRGRSKVFTSRDQKPKDEPEPESLMDVASRVRVQRDFGVSGIVRLGIAAALLAALGAVAYFVVPSATVRITLAEESVSVEDWLITAGPDIASLDIENSTIPAREQIIEVEEFNSRATSGSVDLPDVPARGRVTFVNRAAAPISIPAGTVVSTTSGAPVRYRTLLDVELPGGIDAQVTADIEAIAEFAGSQGNVDTGVINTVESEWAASVTVINLEPVTGGEDVELPAVTQSDYDRLQAAVRQQLQSRAMTEFRPRVPSEMAVIETVRIIEERSDWTRFSAAIGEAAETLTLTMRAQVSILVIDRQLAEQVAFAQMAGQIPRGRLIKPESLEYFCCTVIQTDAENRVQFQISGRGLIAGEANITLLQERLAGRSLDEALTYLRNTLDLAPEAPPEFGITPDGFGRLPLLPVRITIIVQDGA